MDMRLRPLAGPVLLLALAWGSAATAQDRLGPLVTDYNAPVAPHGSRSCGRCGAIHDAHEACIRLYKAVNGYLEPPYHTQSLIYGYYDYAYARGPLITLGSRSLTPGFRGYGLLGSPGYGAGNRPFSRVDLEVLGGHIYPEARHLRPRWP